MVAMSSENGSWAVPCRRLSPWQGVLEGRWGGERTRPRLHGLSRAPPPRQIGSGVVMYRWRVFMISNKERGRRKRRNKHTSPSGEAGWLYVAMTAAIEFSLAGPSTINALPSWHLSLGDVSPSLVIAPDDGCLSSGRKRPAHVHATRSGMRILESRPVSHDHIWRGWNVSKSLIPAAAVLETLFQLKTRGRAGLCLSDPNLTNQRIIEALSRAYHL